MLKTDLHRLHRSETRDGGLAPICADHRAGEQGFLLLGLIVAIFLILLVLGVAAPRVAHELRREREVETIHRGNQYVRAIQVYYRKTGHYPGSIEELEKSNNVRYLRQRYLDPMTGKDDWRLIHVGEAKTTVKGFFGQPLAGIASSGLGSAAGMASPGGTGTAFGSSSSGTGSAFGSPSSGSGSAFATPSTGAGSAPGSAFGSPGAASSTGTGAATTDSTGIASQSATDFKGSGGPFVGVGLAKDGNSITTLNEQTTYATWEFIYDPRIEQLKAKASLFGGGPAAASGTGLGSASDLKSGTGGLNSGANSGTGTQPSSGGFGSGIFGSGTGSTPTPTTNTPQ